LKLEPPAYRVLLENLKRRHDLKDLDADREFNIKMILRKEGLESVD
jgi:hypothetical protein